MVNFDDTNVLLDKLIELSTYDIVASPTFSGCIIQQELRKIDYSLKGIDLRKINNNIIEDDFLMYGYIMPNIMYSGIIYSNIH